MHDNLGYLNQEIKHFYNKVLRSAITDLSMMNSCFPAHPQVFQWGEQ